MIKNNISGYFDYAATTPLSSEAKLAMEPYLTDKFYNPSALYLGAQQNKKDLNFFRSVIAQGLGAKTSEVFFTAGGTEANNLAIQGVMNLNPGSNVVISSIEHESVIAPAGLYDYKFVSVNPNGIVELDQLERTIDDETVLVSIMYANNEVGAIQPIKEISKILFKIREDRQSRGNKKPLYFHSDACQAVNYLDMHMSRLGVDLLTVNSGKIYGPKQCGALYIKTGVNLRPIILGGGQEFGKRSGTENLANIAGFATAWDIAVKNAGAESKRLSELSAKMQSILELKLKDLVLNGPTGYKRLANNINITIPGIDNERILMMLDELGFQVAIGSACSANHGGASHVLKAMGIENEAARSTLRISMGKFTDDASIKQFADALIKTVAAS